MFVVRRKKDKAILLALLNNFSLNNFYHHKTTWTDDCVRQAYEKLEDKKGLIRSRKSTRDMNLEKGQNTRTIHCT
jgi:hypothetical protein